MKVVLASKSPRRKWLMEMLGVEFEVIPSSVDERALREEDPVKLAKMLARLKAEDVAQRIGGDSLVIGADTLVWFEGNIIGKAGDEKNAVRILSGFSGKEHEQITGLCIIDTKTGRMWQDHEVTKARVRTLKKEDVERYASTGDPMEGAGGYTPRGHIMLFERIEGSWTNIIGLPMEKFIPLLGEALKG
jgi:septum formation protein